MANFVLTNSGHNRDDEASKFGMWLFLFTELLLFGGLFLVYTIYRYLNSDAFLHASYELNVIMGTINTVVLLTSSLTVALSITALQKGNTKLSLWLIIATIIFALTFLVIKYFEWTAKFDHGLFPGMEHYNQMAPGEKMFFFLYFFMTGLHGLHVIIGGVLLGFVYRAIQKKEVTSTNFVYLENGGLYWHLVDIIWIFLFPLFYLIH
ncbi:MAG: cytochrome c oxidase subunit 3 [Bacteroidales bacterium]|nr:cytochrome c oxidase subunit 3 [Bacteroidales bacterium]MCF8402432.1 cytochrome c oxidase subunit 3 [Bacteroidales bacterium]